MNKYYYSFLVMLIIPLGGMGTDVYIPSLPAMATYFHIAKALVQYTVTVYMFAMGIGQLFAGPISDSHTRKKQLLLALLLQVICAILILLSPNIYWIIVARFFQGLGAAFMIVPARAILNDIFTGTQLKKHFQYLTIAFAIGPIIAPFIGGYLQHYIGWHANFYFILIYAFLLICLITVTYKETSQYQYTFSMKKFWESYQIILSNKQFIVGSVLLGVLVGYTALFNVVGTFIIQSTLHKSALVYGHTALLMGVGWLLGNTISRLTFTVDKTLKAKIALLATFFTGIVTLMLAIKAHFNLGTVVVPTFIIITMSGSIFSTYIAECLTLFSDRAASVNGVLFSITWIIFGLFTLVGITLKVNTLFPLSLTYLLISTMSVLIYFGILLPLEKRRNGA